MTKVLDITPLRSLIAVADTGGFHRAAASLQLSQSAVSQHVRRLERVLGRPLVEPDGRRARLTPAGVALLAEARQIIATHDEALRRLALVEAPEFVIGATDLAVFITEASSQPGKLVGSLRLAWCAAPGWKPPSADQPWPLIAIEEPCAIRGRALTVLAQHGIRTKVVGDAAYLAGVLNAARGGLGVTLLALAGAPPEGLIERYDLPAAPPISLTARFRPGADPQVAGIALRVLRSTLTIPQPRAAALGSTWPPGAPAGGVGGCRA